MYILILSTLSYSQYSLNLLKLLDIFLKFILRFAEHFLEIHRCTKHGDDRFKYDYNLWKYFGQDLYNRGHLVFKQCN